LKLEALKLEALELEALEIEAWSKSNSFRWRGSLFFACAKKRSSAAAG
jgi:hypothetical protein